MDTTDDPPVRLPPNPIVSFIIGLAIVILASILNAAGLNLTKLDHVRTSTIPKSARRKDWMRPLWLLGMLLYILSQLIGSTLALEYMRAEYVAPLGSTSLVFNFLFARFLVGTPVTSTDIYGTIIVVLGVIGIVAFGSINSGLSSQTDVTHLTYLWRRGGWLTFFFCMAGILFALLVFTERLEAVLALRGDLDIPTSIETSNECPESAGGAGRVRPSDNTSSLSGNSLRWKRTKSAASSFFSGIRAIRSGWRLLMLWITGWLEVWTNPQDDKQITWTLGITWACCGGGLAGLCLVFAKATVKLLSGSLSKQNPGNQFGHAAPVFTILLLSITAIMQIICLNRGLRIYDSTLVVPVFYGIYTATGFLDSLIFNDEVDAYQSWTLFLIFVSILVLISGVVLLTHKKPEPTSTPTVPLTRSQTKVKVQKPVDVEEGRYGNSEEHQVLWTVGDDSDEDHTIMEEDPDVDHHQNPIQIHHQPKGLNATLAETSKGKNKNATQKFRGGEEEVRLIGAGKEEDEEDDNDGRKGIDGIFTGDSSSNSLIHGAKVTESYRDNEEFGDWEGVAAPK